MIQSLYLFIYLFTYSLTPDRSDNLLNPRTDKHADRIHISFSNWYYFIGNLTWIKQTHWLHFDFRLWCPVVALQSSRLNCSPHSSSALHTSSKGRIDRLLRPLFSSSLNTAQTLAMHTLEGCVWKSHNKHQMLSWILSLCHYFAVFSAFPKFYWGKVLVQLLVSRPLMQKLSVIEKFGIFWCIGESKFCVFEYRSTLRTIRPSLAFLSAIFSCSYWLLIRGVWLR